jgi:hypothetical protein
LNDFARGIDFSVLLRQLRPLDFFTTDRRDRKRRVLGSHSHDRASAALYADFYGMTTAYYNNSHHDIYKPNSIRS